MSKVVQFESPEEGTVTVAWSNLCKPMPQKRTALLDAPLTDFAFTHCCGGVMNRATITGKDGPLRDVLWCRLCGGRLRFGLSATLRDLYVWLANKRWPHREV